MKTALMNLERPAITTPASPFIDGGLLIGRILTILALIHSGIAKITDFADVAKAMGGDRDLLVKLFGEQTPLFHFPAPELFLAFALLFDIAGSLLIVLGFRTRLVAFLLLAYSLLAVGIYHSDIRSTDDLFLLLVNAPFFGALLILVAVGGGRWSLDGVFERRRPRFR